MRCNSNTDVIQLINLCARVPIKTLVNAPEEARFRCGLLGVETIYYVWNDNIAQYFMSVKTKSVYRISLFYFLICC